MGEVVAVGASCPNAVLTYSVLGQPWCHLSFANPFFHYHMKHFEIDYHFVHDLVQSSKLCVAHVLTGDQLTDGLTKSLSRSHLFCPCIDIFLYLNFLNNNQASFIIL